MNQQLLKTIILGFFICFTLSNETVFAANIDTNSSPVENPHLTKDAIQIHTPTLTKQHVPYMTGTPDRYFYPNEPLTRGQAAQIVYRLLENQTIGTMTCSYQDITEAEWFYKPVIILCSLGLLDDGTTFRPKEAITRAEFLDILTRFVPTAQSKLFFSDVPTDYWAKEQIQTSVALGWINGYGDGIFCPDGQLTRAEACTIINRISGRKGDKNLGKRLIDLKLYSDVDSIIWAWADIVEASVEHTPSILNGVEEQWASLNLNKCKFSAGFHEVDGVLYYVYTDGKLAHNTSLGAYWADEAGALTLTSKSYQMQNVTYISQLDQILAWVGCEPVSALMGLKAKGFAQNVTAKAFLDALPLTSTNPAKGFVGSPYVPDPSKKTRTTIYPGILSEYCNSYCNGNKVCSDFSGATVDQLQRELLAGNCVVAYMTMNWEKLFYRKFNIEGQTQWLVSNNHAVLVCGYDAKKGYFISDPYNGHKRNQTNQYWFSEAEFNNIWNQRQVGMILR